MRRIRQGSRTEIARCGNNDGQEYQVMERRGQAIGR